MNHGIGRLSGWCGLLLVVLFGCAAQKAEAAVPAGAVQLTPEQLVERSGYFCGIIGKRYVAGRLLSDTSFYPHNAEIKNLEKSVRSSSKKKRAALKKQISKLKSQLAKRAKVCAAIKVTTKPVAMRFNFTGVIGIGDSGPENLHDHHHQYYSFTMYEDGSVRKGLAGLVEDEDAEVGARFFARGPDGNLYGYSHNGIDLENIYDRSEVRPPRVELCVFYQVNTQTGESKCIEKGTWDFPRILNPDLRGFKNNIYRDAAGAIYYADQHSVRKYADGKVTFLISYENIDGPKNEAPPPFGPYPFVPHLELLTVMQDGTVYAVVENPYKSDRDNVNCGTLMRRDPDGALHSMFPVSCRNGYDLTFVDQFPDGKVYYRFSDYGFFNVGIYRSELRANTLEPETWVGGYYLSREETIYPPTINHHCTVFDLCDGLSVIGTLPGKPMVMPNKKVFIFNGGLEGPLLSLWPTPRSSMPQAIGKFERPDADGLAFGDDIYVILNGCSIFRFDSKSEAYEKMQLPVPGDVRFVNLKAINSVQKILVEFALDYAPFTHYIGLYDPQKRTWQMLPPSQSGLKTFITSFTPIK